MEASASDSAVRVVVTPSQSAYFAGEPFTVTITLTNTRTPDAGPPRTASQTHKRAAHSISSAPLARPPTSPGTPRSSVVNFPVRSRTSDDTLLRKNLVGKQRSLPSKPRPTSSRSMSVNLSAQALDEGLRQPPSLNTNLQEGPSVLSPNSIISTSPAHARSPILPLRPNHPHARKQSVLDGQNQIQIDNMPYKPPLPQQVPLSASAATSTFSLALDPISESAISSPMMPSSSMPSPGIDSPVASPFAFPPQAGLPNADGPSNAHSYPPQRERHHPHLGLGRPPVGPIPGIVPPRTAFSSTFPQANTELVLYAYAQLSGTLYLTPLPGTQATPDQAYALRYARSALTRGAVVGGGSMDITSSLRHPQSATSAGLGRPSPRRTHSRSSSISAGLLSLLSPSMLTSSASAPNRASMAVGHRSRTLSQSGVQPPGSAPPAISMFSGTGLGLGSGAEEDIDPEAPLPTLEVQPSMLAVDLALLPGESRSYTYTVKLPEHLPPTFKGRALRFSYELVVGTCRAGPAGRTGTPLSSSGSSTGGASISRVMKVPVRIYNNVSVNRIPRPYDILFPVHNRPATGRLSPKSAKDSGTKATVVEDSASSRAAQSKISGTRDDLQEYARHLLESLSSNEPNGDGSKGAMHGRLKSVSGESDPTKISCRESVDIMTRNSKKASYDVNKEGVRVASLTFTKSAYRLGETVLGVVELNDRTGRSKVLKLSATLEAQESLPTSLSPSSTSRHLRRVHAEHHSSFVASTLRTTFSLDIPSDATPAFHICLGDQTTNVAASASKPGGLEWKVRLCLLVAIAGANSESGTEGVRLRALVRDGPRGDWGSSWRAPAGISPMEKLASPPAVNGSAAGGEEGLPQQRSWAASLMASFLGGSGEREYHDGDEDDEAYTASTPGAGPADGEDDDGGYDGIKADKSGGVGVGVLFGGGEGGWTDVKVEMVECEVPIRVWPGNTAFKAVDVVFDV
ncbi:hypothetical protein HGRIS_014776 [Hohenbuehelia grisea]|uniref:Rgp1-domain-containing protein n=1 Tax=Hohenbuehelia grisea TaxID=104357 RepID=A0ABR3IQQ2_9AGAR